MVVVYAMAQRELWAALPPTPKPFFCDSAPQFPDSGSPAGGGGRQAALPRFTRESPANQDGPSSSPLIYCRRRRRCCWGLALVCSGRLTRAAHQQSVCKYSIRSPPSLDAVANGSKWVLKHASIKNHVSMRGIERLPADRLHSCALRRSALYAVARDCSQCSHWTVYLSII